MKAYNSKQVVVSGVGWCVGVILAVKSLSLMGWLVVYEMMCMLFLVSVVLGEGMCRGVSDILLVGVMISVLTVGVVLSGYVRGLRGFGGNRVWAVSLGLW